MDHDKLVEEVQRLQNWLAEHEPTDENYGVVLDRLGKLSRLGIEFDEACDKQLERQDKLELERDRIDRELDLKEKEIELKNTLEMDKVEDNLAEAAARRRIEKRQAWGELIKIVLSTTCSAALIIVTGKIEQHAILGQHQWALIPKGKF